MKNNRRGFTLVEMLVVIGILGILSAALLSSFAHVRNAALKAEAQKQVGEVATALTVFLQLERAWPQEWLDKGKHEMDIEMCWYMQDRKLLDVTTFLYNDGSSVTNMAGGGINQQSLDRFGLLDPWGRRVLKRDKDSQAKSLDAKPPAGAVNNLIQFALDRNYDGWIDQSEGLPGKGAKVRASAVAWSRGPNGEDDLERHGKPMDDILSWPFAKYEK
ncbi:MAG TPA: type II secretion system protein [Kiritimatiellia bacterium]|nr:type II secretion system protein [Kiritimatiellia bacterium]